MHFKFIPQEYSDRQLALNALSRAVKDKVRQDNPRSFNHEQLVVMLLELAKNTYDHSNGIGILDMQLPSSTKPLLVTYKDTGDSFDWESCSTPGISKKAGNGINFGMGLTLVRQVSAGAGIELVIERIEGFTEFRFIRKARH